MSFLSARRRRAGAPVPLWLTVLLFSPIIFLLGFAVIAFIHDVVLGLPSFAK